MKVVEFVPTARFDELLSPWRNLAHKSLEPNPFYLPEFVKHSFAHKPKTGPQGVLVVRDPTDQESSNLIGLWPLSFALPNVPAVPNFVRGLHSPFMSCPAPLIRAGFEEAAAKGFLDWLEESVGRLGTLSLSEVGLDAPAWRALQTALEQRGQLWTVLEEYERPVLDTSAGETFDAYLQDMKAKKRQSLRRKWRQLAERGELDYARYHADDLPKAMSDFLALERSGWKGAAGTAMDLSDRTRSLAQDVLSNADYGATHIEALRLDGRPIAMSIHIAVNGQAFFFKPAFDETLATYSPGQLLHFKTIEELYRDRWAEQIDSAVLPHDQLSAIWRQRKRVGRVLVTTSPKAPSPLLEAASTTVRAYADSRGFAAQIYRRARQHVGQKTVSGASPLPAENP